MTSWRGVGPDIPPPKEHRCSKCATPFGKSALPCPNEPEVMPDLESWCAVVAGKIGILPPSTDHEHWLRLHRSEAAACMGLVEYGLLSQEMGWDT